MVEIKEAEGRRQKAGGKLSHVRAASPIVGKRFE
jgi:hypothetical protein